MYTNPFSPRGGVYAPAEIDRSRSAILYIGYDRTRIAREYPRNF
jgi:hypothetical protein